jgi:TPR repeat protein
VATATFNWGQNSANGEMKQTLHWNVSGIPPEARDVARAAATKEGLSVGDWLTKRILADRSAGAAAPLAERNGTDSEPRPLGPRLVRIEGEADPARRVDDALRVLSKRIEVGERTHSEAQRSLSAVAAEIQGATRNQAEAFTRLAERIENLEKNSDTAPLRDALRGLHHGVARLTDQIAKATADSAGQVAVLATSVESMALKIAGSREESIRLERLVEDRLSAFSERVAQMEERLHVAPGASQVFETRIDAAEQRMRDAFTQHLAAVERNFAAIAARLDETDQTRGHGFIQETIATLNRKFESSERRGKELMAALQSGLADATARIARLETPAITDDSVPDATELEHISDTRERFSDPEASDPEEVAEPALPEPSGPSEYLAQARRAAQATLDSTTASVWQMSAGVGAARERSRLARILTQAFLLVLVMCAGFLLMRNFGPSLELPLTNPLASPKVSVTPELLALQAKAREGIGAAELLLGLRYADGEGVALNNQEAAQWLERAANKGEAFAQYRLGTLYEKGLGVPPSASVAADWYQKAAELGNVKAMHNLAVAYANGAGRPMDYAEAGRWFRQAADHGLADSQFNLAVLHERGLGVQASLSEAYRWYAIAAAQGDGESETRVEALVSQIPAAERQLADKAAAAFKAAPNDGRANAAPPLAEVLN